jgi:predicted MPP superfamily phosphohydrolase
MLTRRQFLATAAAGAGGSLAALGLYAWRVEPHWVEVVRRPMALEGLPPELVGATLLQVSDLHVGPRVDSQYLIDSLRGAAGLAPDFVLVTGDFVSYRSAREYRELARVLRALPQGKRGTVAALGNHDYGYEWRQLDVAGQVAAVVRDAGATMLRNASRTIGGIQFAGLGDLWSPDFADGPTLGFPDWGARQTLAALDRRLPTVVLCHNPDALDEPIWDGIRGWVLAGHTHGGQCKPPFLPPPILPVRNKRYTSGAFDVGPGRTLYINRGLGHLLRVRFLVRPELTLFTLERAAAASPG